MTATATAVRDRYRRRRALAPTVPLVPTAPVRFHRPLRHVALSAALAGGPVLPVTFPTTDLKVTVRIALGADLSQPWYTWSWLDITDRVRYRDGVTITAGRRDWASRTDTSTCRLRIDNSDGYFSRRNPRSPYYGLLTKQTPIWITVDPGSGESTRYQGYVTEWPTRWTDKSGVDSTVPVVCAGVIRRLSKSRFSAPALTRAQLADNPIGLWELADGADSSQAADSSTNAGPMKPIGGDASFGTATGPAGGRASVVSLDANTGLRAAVSGTSTTWTAETGVNVDGTFDGVWLTVFAGPTWQFDLFPTATPVTSLAMRVIGPGITDSFTANGPAGSVLDDGSWHHVGFSATPSGSDLAVVVTIDGVETSGTFLGAAAAGAMRYVGLNDVSFLPPLAVGSWAGAAVYDSAVDLTGRYQALLAHVGEQARVRLARICAEAGITFYSGAGETTALGPQPIGTVLQIAQDAEYADQGYLHELDWGFGYQSSAQRLNAPIALELDFDQRHVAEEPEPADDDQRTVNRWTSSRTDGSSATVEDEDLTDADPLYDSGGTVNVETDDQLADDAGWRVYLGTVDEDRWPRIALRLHGTPDLIGQWVATPPGARLNLANPPDQVAPDTIDAVIEGHTERFDTKTWDVTLNTSPASPYDVGVLAADSGDTDPFMGWLSADTCTLNTSVAAGAVSLLVNSDPLWTTDSDDFPALVRLAGEVFRVTGVAGASNPQTWTVVPGVNGIQKAHTAGEAIELVDPVVLTL